MDANNNEVDKVSSSNGYGNGQHSRQPELPENLKRVIVLADEGNRSRTLKFIQFTQASFDSHHHQILLYLSSIEPNVESIHFSHCNLLSSSYIRIITHFPNIVELDFHLCNVEPDRDENDDIRQMATLAQLTKFQVMYFNYSAEVDQSRFIELVPRMLSDSEELEDVRFYLSLGDGLVDRYAEVRAIVARQKNLEMLYIGDNRFFEGPLANPEFQLDSFYMPISQSSFSEAQLRNFYEFIETQTEISRLVCNVPVDLRSPTLTDLVKDFDSNDMNSFHAEFDQMQPNPHVKKLYAEYFGEDDAAHAEIIATIVEKYPNLETMEFNYNLFGEKTNMNLLLPLNGLTKLTRLSFLSLLNRQISRIRVPTLKSIEISFEEDDIESLHRFIIRHTGLEQVELIVERDEYESFMPGLYLFIEFALRMSQQLTSFNVNFYNFENDVIDAEQVQSMIDQYASQDDFELIFGFEDNDRECEIFTKS